MARLSEKQHWDYIHVGEEKRYIQNQSPAEPTPPLAKRVAQKIKQLIGNNALEQMGAYDQYLLWDIIFPHYLPPLQGAKVLEVGSAPGEFLVQLTEKYGCIPYGVEYSEVGVELNKAMFRQHGFDPENVIFSDFFSGEFLNKYEEQFDVVVSRGFIEHFSDVESVVDRHIALLKRGGHLIVSIPNLRGLNYALAGLFDRGAIPRHNIDIMKKNSFTGVFHKGNLQQFFCDYYGTFSLYLFTAGRSHLQACALRVAQKAQPFLNLIFRSVFGDKGAENGFFSPSLLYIGKKL